MLERDNKSLESLSVEELEKELEKAREKFEHQRNSNKVTSRGILPHSMNNLHLEVYLERYEEIKKLIEQKQQASGLTFKK
jgi:hypothetical protein